MVIFSLPTEEYYIVLIKKKICTTTKEIYIILDMFVSSNIILKTLLHGSYFLLCFVLKGEHNIPVQPESLVATENYIHNYNFASSLIQFRLKTVISCLTRRLFLNHI